MPARPDPKPSLSRSRTNRITNKTRLRVLVGHYDVETILDDQDGVDYHTHGVEAHESTETHLQRALSATTRRVLGGAGGPANNNKAQPDKQSVRADAIPIPDASGLAAGAAELYPAGTFKDHLLHLRFSDTVEETVSNGLAGGYTYYMDERDNAWLEKNNQEARGEGSSTQAARSATSQGKRNGKGRDIPPAVEMSENEFELVMGLFERRAADPPFPFLHLDPDSFPTMEVYEDWFQTPLSPELFSCFTVPPDAPDSTRLVELARRVYHHWRDRRIERAGHRIVAQLSLDESVGNESYTCFRRRELRPVRRTRRQQDASTAADPMLQLRRELGSCLDLARQIAKREVLKQKCVAQNRALAEARMNFARLKRELRVGERGDEGLLFDKEPRARKKKPPAISLSINTANSSGPSKRAEPAPRKQREQADRASPATIVQMPNYARQRAEEVQLAVEKDIARQKQEDVGFDDVLDFPYQKMVQPAPQRLFKAPPGPGRLLTAGARAGASAAYRLRIGRGGRLIMDRQRRESVPSVPQKRTASVAFPEDEDMDREERIRAQWAFDADTFPEAEVEGLRLLVDDYHTELMRNRSTLVPQTDSALYFQQSLETRQSASASPGLHVSPAARGANNRRRASTARHTATPTVPTPTFTLPSPSSALAPPSTSSLFPTATASASNGMPRASSSRAIAPNAAMASTQPAVSSPLSRQPVQTKAEPRIAPAKPRLRLAEGDGVPVKASAKPVNGSTSANGKPTNGVPRGAYPHLQGNPVEVLGSRANFAALKRNGHAGAGAASPPANGNANTNGHGNGSADHSRSPSAESSRAAATSESVVSDSTAGS